MCLFCVEYQKNKLTLCEAWKNLAEMKTTLDEKHAEAVEEMLWEDWFSQVGADSFLVSATNAYEQPSETPTAWLNDFWYLDSWYDEHGQGD